MCFHKDTERIRIDQRAQHTGSNWENKKTLTETSQKVRRSVDACVSFARVAFQLCVVVKLSGYVQQRTGVQLLIVEQDWLSLGTN